MERRGSQPCSGRGGALAGERRAGTFLDSSVITDVLAGVDDGVGAVQERGQPYLTSAIRVFEVLDGAVGGEETDVFAVREQFGGVRALDLIEHVAIEAVRIRDRLMDDSE